MVRYSAGSFLRSLQHGELNRRRVGLVNFTTGVQEREVPVDELVGVQCRLEGEVRGTLD